MEKPLENERLLVEPLLSSELARMDAWRREGDTITKTFIFEGFKGAMAFANRVADAANAANHHPDIHVEHYKTVRIVLTTHAVGGISQADIDLAKRIDDLTR